MNLELNKITSGPSLAKGWDPDGDGYSVNFCSC